MAREKRKKQHKAAAYNYAVGNEKDDKLCLLQKDSKGQFIVNLCKKASIFAK